MLPHEIGTEKYPLRISSLPMLIKCPSRIAMQMIDNPERSSSPAADTGTAAHYAISLYHEGAKPDAAVAEMRAAASHTFPLADCDEAEKFVRSYFADPRNTPEAVKHSELQVKFTLDPHTSDPTQEKIYIQGTTDQVRETPCGLEVWDYKTGKDEGVVLLHEHLLQLAGYTKGVEATLNRPVVTCGIIRGRGYTKRGTPKPELAPPGVFFDACLDPVQVNALLYRVRSTVAAIRRGEGLFGPGPYCNHCPYEGTSVCVPKGISLGLRSV